VNSRRTTWTIHNIFPR